MKEVLRWGASPGTSLVNHQDIAHGCDRFHIAMFDIDTDHVMDVATGIAADVDAQGDMFLANTYTLEELQQLYFSEVHLPVEWLQKLPVFQLIVTKRAASMRPFSVKQQNDIGSTGCTSVILIKQSTSYTEDTTSP